MDRNMRWQLGDYANRGRIIETKNEININERIHLISKVDTVHEWIIR